MQAQADDIAEIMFRWWEENRAVRGCLMPQVQRETGWHDHAHFLANALIVMRGAPVGCARQSGERAAQNGTPTAEYSTAGEPHALPAAPFRGCTTAGKQTGKR
jgi:hypothetical protein